MSVRKPTISRKAKIAGTKKPTPTKVLKKALRKKFLGKAALVKKVWPPLAAADALYSAYSLGMPAISKSYAKSFGEENPGMTEEGKVLTPEAYRKVMGEIHTKVKGETAKRAAIQGQKRPISPFEKKERKKGGRVSRPKGVGAAKRGYGKAMKRGK